MPCFCLEVEELSRLNNQLQNNELPMIILVNEFILDDCSL